MAEKDQEQIRIRLEGRLLKRIDAARTKDGRTRNDEIERRLLESFLKNDLIAVSEMAVHNVLVRVHRMEEERAAAEKRPPLNIYEALYQQAKKEVEDLK